MELSRYHACRFLSNGMEYPRVNCWGLVRSVRYDLGYPLLPTFGIFADDKKAMTGYSEQLIGDRLIECELRHGAIALAWRGKLCIHVGLVLLVDGRMLVIDINSSRPVSLTPVKQWSNQFTKVRFFYDRNDQSI